MDAIFENVATGEKHKADFMLIVRYLFDTYLELSFTCVIHFVCSIMLVVFTVYHSYLIYTNSTTAESSKYSEYCSYYSKKVKLLKWIQEDVEEVKKMFNEKELDQYAIDKKKIEEEKYIADMLINSNEIISRLDNFPYSRQKLKDTLYDIFVRED